MHKRAALIQADVNSWWEVGDKAGELISRKIYFCKKLEESCKATFTLSQNIFHNKEIVEDVKLKL